MPTVSIIASDWQVLRRLKRAAEPVLGRELRITRTRKTKDGAFLIELEGRGLIINKKCSAKHTKETPWESIPAAHRKVGVEHLLAMPSVETAQ